MAQTAVQAFSEQRVEMLEGFAKITAERWGYVIARKVKQAELNEATSALRADALKLRKSIGENIETLIETPTKKVAAQIVADRTKLGSTMEEIREASKPYREAMSPLNKAVRHMDSVVIPLSLEQLGLRVQPLFNLSEWVKDSLEAVKKAKKAK